MHRVPLARRHVRTVDPDAVCAGAADPEDAQRTRRWAELLSAVGEPGRLTLLLCLHRAGELCVTDLAVASGIERSAVSHALRLLREAGAVEVTRDSRLARYRLGDPLVHDLLHLLGAEDAVLHGCGHAKA